LTKSILCLLLKVTYSLLKGLCLCNTKYLVKLLQSRRNMNNFFQKNRSELFVKKLVWVKLFSMKMATKSTKPSKRVAIGASNWRFSLKKIFWIFFRNIVWIVEDNLILNNLSLKMDKNVQCFVEDNLFDYVRFSKNWGHYNIT
jgi:hypothetical protein